MELLSIIKKPVVQIVIAIILSVYMATGENTFFCIFLLLLFILLLIYLKTSKEMVLVLIIVVCLFFTYGLIKKTSLSNYMREKNEGQIKVAGMITAINKIDYDYVSVTIKEKGFLKSKVQLKLYDCQKTLYPGLYVSCKGFFLKPGKKTNIGGYDEENYMYSNNIYGKVYTFKGDYQIEEGRGLRAVLGKVYADVRKRCITMFGEYKGNILAGMLIGAKEGVEKETVSLFRISGLSHTMAVSGSHVMYLMVPLLFMFSKVPIKKRKYYPIIALILVLFCFLTCLKPSVLRATITALILLSSDYFYEQYDSVNALSLSAIILLMFNPLTIYDAGFILSYSCVTSILVLYAPLYALIKKIYFSSAIALSLAIQLGIMMVSAKIFYTFYTFSFLVNLIILPVRMILTIAGWITYFIDLVFPFLSHILATIVSTMLDYILITASFFSSFNIATFSIPYISPLTVLTYFLTLLIFLYSKKIKVLITGILIIAISVFIPYVTTPPFQAVFFDVGQGDSSMITVNHKDIMIDCGEYAPLNAIAYYAGNVIDYIFITHSHSDHIGGVYDIIDQFTVKNIVIPDVIDEEFDQLIALCKSSHINLIRTKKDDEFIVKNLMLTIMNPMHEQYTNINNSSIVLTAEYKNLSILYTGDIEKEAEKELILNYDSIPCDILKVAHHGSNTSTIDSFYQLVSPSLEIISVGYNKFGHPSAETLEKLKRYYRTDQLGAIIIQYKNNHILVETGRK